MRDIRFIMKLALPAIAEMILHMMVGLVDIAMVGRLGADSLTAVSLGSQYLWTMIFLFASVGIGAGAIVARAVGAENYEEAGRIAGQVIAITIIIGAIILALSWTFAPNIYDLFAPNQLVKTLGVKYLRILSISTVFFLVLLVGEAVCRSAGFTQIPLKVALVGNTINIILDYVLIFGKLGFPALGVPGAAMATAISYTISCIIIVFVLFSGRIPIKIKINDIFPLRRETFARIMKLSIPAGAEELVRASSNLVSIYLIVGLGSVSYAAHQVAHSVESISFMPGFGFGIAAGALVGQSLGALKPERAERLALKTLYLAAGTMTAAALGFFLLSTPLVKVFTNDLSIIPIAASVIKIAAFAQTSIAVELVLAGALRGAGDTRFPMCLSLLGNWVIRIPLFFAVLHVFHMGLTAVWWVTVFQWFVMAVLAFWRFKQGKWKRIIV
ncbi:MAG: MATE family efflux transporter [Bacillota bacterium]